MTRHSTARSRPQILGAGLLAAALLAGCSSGATEGRPDLGPLPVVRSYDDIVLPIDHYQGTPRDRVTVQTAINELIADCMEERGFPGYPVEDLTSHTFMPASGNTFGVVSEADARTHGESVPWAPAMEAEGAAYTERFAGWTGGEITLALDGAPTPTSPEASADDVDESQMPSETEGDGCRAEGHRRLYELAGTEPLDRWWIDLHRGRTISAAEQDPRMKPVKQAWSDCMRERDYDYVERNDVGGDERWLIDEQAGKDAAVASVQCTHESRVVDTWVALATAYQNEVIEDNAERFANERAGRDALLKAIRSRGLGNIGGREGGPPPE